MPPRAKKSDSAPKTKSPKKKAAPKAKEAKLTNAVGAVPTPARAAPSHAAIAARAHQIHLEMGGSAIENWLQAERELARR